MKEKNSTNVLREKFLEAACWAAVRKWLAQNESQVVLSLRPENALSPLPHLQKQV